MANPKNTAVIATYADHEVITPENKLRKAVSAKPIDDDDPVARAELALAALSSAFGSWMESECDRLDQARQAISKGGFSKVNRDALFHAAHDIKGEAATFGFPLAAAAADSLCRLIEYTPESRSRSARRTARRRVRAIHREYSRSDAEELAALLTNTCASHRQFRCGDRDRPDVLEQLWGRRSCPNGWA